MPIDVLYCGICEKNVSRGVGLHTHQCAVVHAGEHDKTDLESTCVKRNMVLVYIFCQCPNSSSRSPAAPARLTILCCLRPTSRLRIAAAAANQWHNVSPLNLSQIHDNVS